jgi:hypothetical protein
MATFYTFHIQPILLLNRHLAKVLHTTETACQVLFIFSLTDGHRIIFINEQATLTAFAFFDRFGFSSSNFNFLFAAVGLKLLSGVKCVGPFFFPRIVACLFWTRCDFAESRCLPGGTSHTQARAVVGRFAAIPDYSGVSKIGLQDLGSLSFMI